MSALQVDEMKKKESLSQVGNLSNLYLDYDYTLNIHQRIDEFHMVSSTSKTSNVMVLYGETGSGKSTLVDHYYTGYKQLESPILRLNVPSKCTQKSLASDMLHFLGDPSADKGTLSNMTRRVVHFILHKNISLIILDEFQHFINVKNERAIYDAADWLKSLSNEVSCSFLLVGLPETRVVLETNTQLGRRVVSCVNLPTFPLDTNNDYQRFATILALFANDYPFDNASIIVDKEVVRAIHKASQGTIGRVVNLLKLTGMNAIRDGESVLRPEHFQRAFDELRQKKASSALAGNPFRVRKSG